VKRLDVTLDSEHAAKLVRLAERRHMPMETLAGSLLSRAIDDAEVDPRHVVEVLDGIAVHMSGHSSASSRHVPAGRCR
jgi:hypothetical protein